MNALISLCWYMCMLFDHYYSLLLCLLLYSRLEYLTLIEHLLHNIYKRMKSFDSIILVLILLLGSLDPILCGVHYIIPETNTSCDANSCLTFSQFADSSTSYVAANTTLFIVGGSHDLDREITVSNVEAFTMIGINSSITCSGLAKFTFTSIGQVRIDGLTFTGCGSNKVTMVNQLTIEHAFFGGQSSSRTSILISETNAAITQSSFLSNTIGSCRTDLSFFKYLQIVPSTSHPESSCAAAVGGALIIRHSNLVISDSHFEGNHANLGGAIYSELESNITISSSNFTDNHATDCDAQLCFGGVLFADETSSVSIFDSIFQNNTSNGDGGVAAIFNANLSISQGFIDNNSANRYGGALATFLHSSVTLKNIRISFCTAEFDGGAVYTVDTSTLKMINDSKFIKNSANRYGGVLYAETKASVILNHCSILNNTAIEAGGAFHATNAANVSIRNSIFVYNTAHANGGSIYLGLNSAIMIMNTTFNHSKTLSSENTGGGAISLQNGSHAVISGGRFYHNMADKYGGAIQMVFNCTIYITDTIFDNNIVSDEGGVIDAFIACNVTVYGSIFTSNKVNVSGGVSTIKFGSSFYSENCSFTNNSARDSGAVLLADEECHTIIHNCTFTHNSADNGGVLMALRNNDLTIDNCWFIGNTAFTDGGTLHIRIKCTATIYNSTFTDNVATNNGVLLASVSSNIAVESSSFSENEAGHDGGVVYVYDNSTLQMNNCTSTNNVARGSGGVVYGRKNCIIEITDSKISDCTAQLFGGTVSIQEDSSATIEATNFTNNSANTGGVMRAYIGSTISIDSSTLSENMATMSGGVMAAYRSSTIWVQATNFTNNRGGYGGVAFIFENSIIVFEQCHFLQNMAEFEGIFNLLQQSIVQVIGSTVRSNTAVSGGVAYVQNSSMIIQSSNFEYNKAIEKGGVIYTDEQTTLSIYASNFTNNTVENDGGVMTCLGGSHTTINNCSFISNNADSNGGVIGIQHSNATIVNSTFCSSKAGSSGGVVCAISSEVIFNDSTFINNSANGNGGVMDARLNSSIIVITSYFFNNTAKKSGGVLYVEEQSHSAVYNSVFQLNTAKSDGGVISITTSSDVNVTKTNFSQNTAGNGSAIAASKESSIAFVSFLNDMGQTSAEGIGQICNNMADIGGGIYLIDSALYFKMETCICHNLAHASGGGIYAFNSSIIFGTTVNFVNNQAMSGGGMSLATSKLYDTINDSMIININFVSNHAMDYGGAMYVADEIDCMCSSDSYLNNSGCFFQNLTNSIVFNFDENSADSSGHDLFGGLLDRCSFVSDTNLSSSDSSGALRFKELSNLQNFNTVSSEPVRVCPCQNGELDCSQQQQSIQISRGDGVTISIVAIDQVNQPVTAIIQSNIDGIALPESQRVQSIGPNCTRVDYDISLPNVGENHVLTVFADGPCNDEGISKFVVDIHISSCTCPVGFMPTDDSIPGCTCECDKKLSNYITDCNITTMSVIREGLFWITYINDPENDTYFIYPYCPLDYCQPPSDPISVNLNLPQGSDAQCTDNHQGILCGSCQVGYSLSLGGSKCIKCPSTWWYDRLTVIIVSSLLAGIVLVIILLVLNITVAIGTINSIIFYANIIYSNRRVYFGQSNLTFIPVFISWLNLDIGIDICFFEGMDAYAKTWLQLAFPVYIIFLVFMIIWVSSCSSKFSRLLGKRDPVATLATLILISYTKLLETITTTFSFAPFQFSNHTTSLRWLPDASVEFGKGKHIALICVAALVFLLCLVYTVLIFAWQWLLYCSRAEICGKWTRNHKLNSFINTYHIPYSAKHRYWTGLLLLLRVIVYIITAVSASSDQPIASITTAAVMSCLLLYKTVLIVRIYKSWLLNSMEAFVYFNLSIFALITSFTVANPPSKNKEFLHVIFSYLSVGTILILLLLVIAYHVFKYGCSCLHPSSKSINVGRKGEQSLQEDDRSLSINDILDAIDNPRRAGSRGSNVPTRTVISLTNQDESLTVASSPPNQPITPEEHSVAPSNETEEGTEGNRPMKAPRTFASKSVKVTTPFQGAVKRSKPKLLYYSAEYQIPQNETLRKPLLDEDNL